MVLINHGERTRVSLQLGGLLKHLKDSDLQATDQWEASSFVLHPGKDAGSGLTKWAQPLVQGLEVDPAALIVVVDVPSLSMMSLRIKRTSKKEVRHTFPINVPTFPCAFHLPNFEKWASANRALSSGTAHTAGVRWKIGGAREFNVQEG
jgi:hypothetical protein